MEAQVLPLSKERGTRTRNRIRHNPVSPRKRRSEGPRAFALVESREGTMGKEVPTPSCLGRKRSAGGGSGEKVLPENPA